MLWCSSAIGLYCLPIELSLLPILASYILVVVGVVIAVVAVAAENLASYCFPIADLGGSFILDCMYWRRGCSAFDSY